MKRMPAIKSVMTPFPYSIDTGATLNDAQKFMHEHRIRHLPVTDNGSLAGMISERDIRLLSGPDAAHLRTTLRAENAKVAEIMARDIYVVDLETRVDEVLAHMAAHHLGAAIVTRKGRLAGVFTVTDACHHFAEFLRDQVRRSGGDDAA